MNSGSRIEIYNSRGERTVVEPPEGREFSGDYAYAPKLDDRLIRFETRPLPTPKEQRAEKLKRLLGDDAAYFLDGIEAIFAKYPDLEEK